MSDDELDEIIGKGKGDPDFHGYKPKDVHYIGEDRALIERQPIFNGIHWSERDELGYIGEQQAKVRDPWEYGDNDKSDPFNNIDGEYDA